MVVSELKISRDMLLEKEVKIAPFVLLRGPLSCDYSAAAFEITMEELQGSISA